MADARAQRDRVRPAAAPGSRACVAGLRVQARKLLVGHVGQAQRVAVGQQHALLPGAQQRRVGQAACTPMSRRNGGVSRKSRLPTIKATWRWRAASRSTWMQRASNSICTRVVAEPELEQVAEDDHRIGPRAVHVGRPGLEGARQGVAQVQVGDEVDRLPAVAAPPIRGRRQHAGYGRHRRRRARVSRSRRRARSSPSSSGTSAWPAAVAGAHLLDRVHHLGARDDAAEDRIAPALRPTRP